MCWKTSQSVPEPNPAMSLSVTEEPQLEGVLSCSENTHSCNSTVTICHNDGLVCCLDHEPKTVICACREDFLPPECLHEKFVFESRHLDMGSAGIAGIIAFIVIAVLAIVITAVVLVIRRRRRIVRQRGGNEDVALNSTKDPKHAQDDPVGGSTGNDRNGS